MAESESDIRITTDTPYLAPMGELWGVYCEHFGETWPHYNGTVLYLGRFVICIMDTELREWTSGAICFSKFQRLQFILLFIFLSF